ncbi:MAG: hypothetical protein ABII22_03885 [Candidatus Micrarchaeota archaeon]
MKIDYSSLRDIQRKESESAAIVSVDDGFYGEVSEVLSAKTAEAFRSNSLLAIRECENLKRIVLGIFSKREEKIILMALRNENNSEGLTKEEKEMLKNLVDIINKRRSHVNDLLFLSKRRVRILKDVEQYTGTDNNTYGPFKTGEECSLPKVEADWLLKSKLADLI